MVHAQGNEDILTALDANDSDDDDDKNGAPPNKGEELKRVLPGCSFLRRLVVCL